MELADTIGSAYTIERELAGGGMSRVFLAKETRLQRRVVIKLLSPEMMLGISAERFEREVLLAAALQEPHIVPVLSAGETSDGLPYYVMPYVDGDSLRARMQRGPVPAIEALSILRDVMLALAYAHKRGVAHRDIKPGNVLLSTGTAVVTDFGIAKALKAAKTAAPGGNLTQVGTSLGTPAYMAPEQAVGGEVDERADLYAWAVMAYELLSGQHPFPGCATAQQFVAAHVAETPKTLSSLRVDVPRAVIAVVAQCLAKDRDDRPKSADDVIAVLDGHRVPTTRRTVALRAAAVVGVAFGVMATAVAIRGGRSAASPKQAPLIAVLPFETEGANADSSFADGLSDAVTGKLAQLSGLRVIDRKSVLSAREAGKATASAQAIGKTLGAEYVLRASVRWARAADGAPRVQVSPTLVKVADGTAKWAGDPEVVSPADPFTVQASLATKVATALDVALGSHEREKLAARGTNDTAAFAAYVHAQRMLRENGVMGGSALSFTQAAREFERAYRADPNYADALGGGAEAMMRAVVAGAPASLIDSAANLAKRALALSPHHAEATVASAGFYVLRNQPREALALLDQASKENPSNTRLLELRSWLMAFVGDSANAWQGAQRLLTLAPRSPDALRGIADVAQALRRFDDAERVTRRAMALEPDRFDNWMHMAAIAEGRADTTALAQAIHEFRTRGGRISIDQLPFLRHGDAALRAELAAATPATYNAMSGRDSSLFYMHTAQLFLSSGDSARARALVDTAWTVVELTLANPRLPAAIRSYLTRGEAWIAAARGDRTNAMRALGEADKAAANLPDSFDATSVACASARVHALLGDMEAMLPPLKRCLTRPFGGSAEMFGEAGVPRYMGDPRVREIAGPFLIKSR